MSLDFRTLVYETAGRPYKSSVIPCYRKKKKPLACILKRRSPNWIAVNATSLRSLGVGSLSHARVTSETAHWRPNASCQQCIMQCFSEVSFKGTTAFLPYGGRKLSNLYRMHPSALSPCRLHGAATNQCQVHSNAPSP